MSKQIVISGNRILAHGEDCFLTMGGTVICPDSGRIYQNATVVTVDDLPADVDSVGYEYHAGKFIPCAPFGVGTGNIAVFCSDDCKALKDSGIPVGRFSLFKKTSYLGIGGDLNVTLDGEFTPQLAVIYSTDGGDNNRLGLITNGFSLSLVETNNRNDTIEPLNATLTDKKIYIKKYSDQANDDALNHTGLEYTVLLFG